MCRGPGLLFSSFEPSGDALAAETIAALLRHEPRPEIHALGGPRMEAAGAELLERTTHHGSMFLESVVQAWSHHRRLKRLRRWLEDHPIDALVAVDSPAANWSVCRTVRQARPQARIVHLVAPQLWAWAPWRIRRLRRLTDHVLCLLPFEPSWLGVRGVRASFVGHPAFDDVRGHRAAGPDWLPADHPRLALLPGSRTGEISRNWPTMLEAFARLSRGDGDLRGIAAVHDERAETLVRRISAERHSGLPDRLTVVAGRAELVLDWCDAALVASGTVTLQAAARLKPMVIMYNMSRLSVFLARWVVRTRTFTLPNLVSEWAGLGRAVPELVPHHGDVDPVVRLLEALLHGGQAARRQHTMLMEVSARFGNLRFTEEAARQVLTTVNPPR